MNQDTPNAGTSAADSIPQEAPDGLPDALPDASAANAKRKSQLRIETPSGSRTKRSKRGPPLTPRPRLASPFSVNSGPRSGASIPTPYVAAARKELDEMVTDTARWSLESQQILHFHHNHVECAMREFGEHAKNEMQELTFNSQKMGEDCVAGIVNPLRSWLSSAIQTLEQMQADVSRHSRGIEEAYISRKLTLDAELKENHRLLTQITDLSIASVHECGGSFEEKYQLCEQVVRKSLQEWKDGFEKKARSLEWMDVAVSKTESEKPSTEAGHAST